ncbi:hypothetical protein A9X00_24090 [Mycobacterium sp. 1245805.9]|nr:hypothetical protein A9X00_24090 [Mycobacterium sp. 1245805.9]
MHFHLDPALLLEDHKGFAHGNPAGAEFGSDVFLGESLAGAKLAVDDLAAKVIGNELPAAAALE